MSVDGNGLSFLAYAKARGASFVRPATIGRQGLCASPTAVRRAFAVAGLDSRRYLAFGGVAPWLDPVLKCFGAEEIVSVDASDYEGASYVYDLNTSLPEELEAKFSVVIDAGTLEHVFDFPTAIRNVMRMVEVGGFLILITPTNNEAGHGFYQFSPELMFRVLSATYGFVIDDMLLRELGRPLARWYRVRDPDVVGQRAQFRSRNVTYLFIRARRIGNVPVFHPAPQQSDYVAAWRARQLVTPAEPRGRLTVTSLASILTSYSKSGGVLRDMVSRPVAWGRQFRMFQRSGYARLPSHFRRLGRDLQ